MEIKTMDTAMLAFKIIAIVILLYFAFRIIYKFSKDPQITLVHKLLALLLTSFFFQPGLIAVIGLIRSVVSGQLFTSFIKESSDSLTNIKGKGSDPNLMWSNLVMFIILFMITSYFMKYIFNYQKDSAAEPGVTRTKSTAIQNLIVVFIFILSIYFSISAIIAVPIFNFEPNYESNLADLLRTEIDSLAKNDTLIKKDYIQFIKGDPAENSAHIDSVLQDTRVTEDNILEVNSIFRDIETLKSRAVNRMKMTDLSDITPRLKLKDKSQLATWYLTNRTNLLNYLYSQETFIHNFTNELQYQTNLDHASIKNLLATEQTTTKPDITELKERPSLGSDLGVFTFFTGWLLMSESYSLVIIIGLIGFGLLGAGGSTFIREQTIKTNQSLLIEDLPGVMIKGFTAAIVVFLGVQGGLAVLTNTETDVNAYALFFVTFVAAVFSEDAWSWAKGKFGSTFPGEKNESGGGASLG